MKRFFHRFWFLYQQHWETLDVNWNSFFIVFWIFLPSITVYQLEGLKSHFDSKSKQFFCQKSDEALRSISTYNNSKVMKKRVDIYVHHHVYLLNNSKLFKWIELNETWLLVNNIGRTTLSILLILFVYKFFLNLFDRFYYLLLFMWTEEHDKMEYWLKEMMRKHTIRKLINFFGFILKN